MPNGPLLARLLHKLEGHSHLDDADRRAIVALPFILRTLDPAAYLVREGDAPTHCCVILSGFAYRHKVTGDGGRQIIALHIPGEFIDLQNGFLEVSDHHVQALTQCEVGFVPREAIRAISEAFPHVRRAFWTDTLIDASIFREWTVNVGRRSSIARIAHLLCEIGLRLEAAGLSDHDRYELPMTQEQLADAVGLTPVHVNRVLKELGRLGLIERNRRAVVIPDWEKLRAAGDFNARYLHLDQASAIRESRVNFHPLASEPIGGRLIEVV